MVKEGAHLIDWDISVTETLPVIRNMPGSISLLHCSWRQPADIGAVYVRVVIHSNEARGVGYP